MCSFNFELPCGLCSKSCGITMAVPRATLSNAVPAAYALYTVLPARIQRIFLQPQRVYERDSFSNRYTPVGHFSELMKKLQHQNFLIQSQGQTMSGRLVNQGLTLANTGVVQCHCSNRLADTGVVRCSNLAPQTYQKR